MATKLSIINMALNLLGEEAVNSVLVQNSVVGAMANLFETLVEQELAYQPYSFSQKILELQEAATAPPSSTRFNYAYQLPQDLVQLQRLLPAGDYNIVGNQLFSNYTSTSSPLSLVYTCRVDPSQYTIQFASLVSYALASQCALLTTQNLQLSSYFDQQAAKMRMFVANRDSISKPSKVIESSPILAAYLSGR